MNKQKGLAPILIIILIALAVGGYLFIQKQPKPVSTSQPSPSPIASDEIATWKTYTNNKYGYSVKYPGDKFVSCENITEDTGLRLWKVPFDCPYAHDVPYKIGVVIYKTGEYKEYKTPATTEELTIDEVKAIKKTYQYTEADGPLFSAKGSTEVVITRRNNTYLIQFLGVEQENLAIFDQILSTFRFTQ